MAVRSPDGGPSWYSGISDASTATLTTTVAPKSGPTKISYDTFVDTEAGQRLRLPADQHGRHDLDERPDHGDRQRVRRVVR